MSEYEKIFYLWGEKIFSYNINELLEFICDRQNQSLLLMNPEEYQIFHNIQNTEPNRFKIDNMLTKENVNITYMLGVFKNNKVACFDSDIKNLKIVNWPLFLMHYTNYWMPTSAGAVTNINKLFVSLNHRSKLHRKYLIDQMFKHNLNNYGNISWHYVNDETASFKFKYFKNEIIKLDNLDINKTVPNEYFTSLFNVITESDTTHLDISEKTWHAIINKKPFIILGGQHIHRMLRELGFEVFEEVFDYEFDNLLIMTDRADNIISQLNELKDINYNSTYQTLLPKIIHNYNHFYKLLNDRSYVPEIFLNLKDQIKLLNNPIYNSIYKRFN